MQPEPVAPPAANPYAAPRAAVGGQASHPAIQVRRGQLPREAAIRGMGAAMLFVAAPLLALVMVLPFSVRMLMGAGDELVQMICVTAAGLGGVLSTVHVGRRLLGLARPHWFAFLVVLGFSLLAAPVGPLLVAAAWALGHTGAGRAVVSGDGAELRRQTADLRPPLSRQLGVFGLAAALLLVVEPLGMVLLIALLV